MKVTYVPNQPHCYAFGGFEIQMLSAFEAAKNQGASMKLFDPWDRNADFDIVHVWGLDINQYHNILYAKRTKKKIVVTALMHDFSVFKVRLKFFVSSYIHTAKIFKKLAAQVDRFVAVNEIEKKYIHEYYNFPNEKIEVIPNIVNDVYFSDVNTLQLPDLGIKDFVLCTGNICSRKNQLNLVKACNELNYNVLLMGNILESEPAYGQKVKRELEKNPKNKWISNVKENSTALLSAYKNCNIFALVSHHEQGPISAMEATAMDCKVLLADRNYATQAFFKNALRANPNSISDIKKKLERLQSLGSIKSSNLIETCRKENIGKLYIDLYNKLI